MFPSWECLSHYNCYEIQCLGRFIIACSPPGMSAWRGGRWSWSCWRTQSWRTSGWLGLRNSVCWRSCWRGRSCSSYQFPESSWASVRRSFLLEHSGNQAGPSGAYLRRWVPPAPQLPVSRWLGHQLGETNKTANAWRQLQGKGYSMVIYNTKIILKKKKNPCAQLSSV